MAPKTTHLVILFADISGSTRLFETLGDQKARTKVSEVLKLLTAAIKQHAGTVIKTIGDEVMCTFTTTGSAVAAACAMQESMEDHGTTGINPQMPIKVRIGLHFGPALLESNDVFGDAVNVAARMAAQAKGGQIITTGSTAALMEKDPQNSIFTRFVDRAPIKGKEQEIDIHEIIWQEEDVTRMSTGMMHGAPKGPGVILHVKYRNTEIELGQNRTSLVMGRSQACDLPIQEKLASRQHVRIELRRDKFFIIDQSTNGTHVLLDNVGDSFLRREEMPITGSGRISLGRSFNEEPTEVVYFSQG